MENNGRLYWIDGLKGICAVIVVAAHVYAAVRTNLVEANMPLVHILYDGNFAVSAFIILSSILTGYSLEKHRGNILERYRYIVLKRYFRLMIPVGIIIVIMYILGHLGGYFMQSNTDTRLIMNG